MRPKPNTNGLPVVIVLIATIAVALTFVKKQMGSEQPLPTIELPGKVWIGQKATPITLKDEQEKDFALGNIMGKKPVVLIFYSGISDIYSQGQLIMTLPYEKQLAEFGASIYLISMGKAKEERDAFYSILQMRKLKRPGKVFQFLSDPQGAAASSYAGNLSVASTDEKTQLRRATFAIGKDRIIKYAYITLSKKTLDDVTTLLSSVKDIASELKSTKSNASNVKLEEKPI